MATALKSIGGAAVEAVGVPAYQKAVATITAAELAALPDPTTTYSVDLVPAIPATARLFGAVADTTTMFADGDGDWASATIDIKDGSGNTYATANVEGVGELAVGSLDLTTKWSGETMALHFRATLGGDSNLHNTTAGDMTVTLYYSEVG